MEIEGRGEGGEGGSAKERVESVGRMTVRGSLARAQRSNGLWQPRRGMPWLGRGGGGGGGAGFPTSFRSLFGLISWAGRQRGKLIGIH